MRMTRNPVHVSQFSFQGLICDIFAIGFAIFWNMLYAKTDLLWVMGADTIISFFSAWDHETFSNMTFSCCSLFNVKHFKKYIIILENGLYDCSFIWHRV